MYVDTMLGPLSVVTILLLTIVHLKTAPFGNDLFFTELEKQNNNNKQTNKTKKGITIFLQKNMIILCQLKIICI